MNGKYLLHAFLAPTLHPLHRAALVEGRVALTVDSEGGILTVHHQDNVKIGQDTCNHHLRK